MRTILITLATILTVTSDTGLAIRVDPSTMTPMEAIKLAQAAAPGGGGRGRSKPGDVPNPCVDPCNDCYVGDEVCFSHMGLPGTAPNPCADVCSWCYDGDEVCPTAPA